MNYCILFYKAGTFSERKVSKMCKRQTALKSLSRDCKYHVIKLNSENYFIKINSTSFIAPICPNLVVYC